MSIYLASPYGFTDAGREFMNNTMIPKIKRANFEILNPWDDFDSTFERFQRIDSLKDILEQKKLFKELNQDVSKKNEELLKQSQIVVAILDGSDVDSGVASEIGYAYALRKKIIGYRSDYRLTGDDLGAVVNIQIDYFINKSGGYIVKDLADLMCALNKLTK
jgi:nucleoside 2-deoxyribosyltransferase